jgi:hypothetical protein
MVILLVAWSIPDISLRYPKISGFILGVGFPDSRCRHSHRDRQGWLCSCPCDDMDTVTQCYDGYGQVCRPCRQWPRGWDRHSGPQPAGVLDSGSGPPALLARPGPAGGVGA